MPYITAERREALATDEGSIETVGDINYLLTEFVTSLLGPDARYADFNAMIGVLESVKLELYRRMVAPYEDAMAAQNGDVYQVSGLQDTDPE